MWGSVQRLLCVVPPREDGAIRLRNDEMITQDYYVEAQHDGWKGSCEVASVHHQLPLLFSKG
jgi:hypothetical protein